MTLLPELMTIGEMIDSAFGDPERNVVHHKLIQAILYLLARQLRLLDRQVKIELLSNVDFYSSESSIVVSEVKIHADVMKKRRGQGGKNTGGLGEEGGAGGAGGAGGGGKGGIRGAAVVTGPGKGGHSRSSSRLSDTRRSSTTVQPHDRTGGKITTTPTGKVLKTSETADLSISKTHTGTGRRQKPGTLDRSSTDDSTQKSSTEKSSTEKSSTEKSSTEKSSAEKSTTQRSTTEKSSSDKTTTESPTEKTTTLDKTSSFDQTLTEMTATEKTTTSDKSSSEKTTTQISTDKSITDKSSTLRTTTDKSTTDKSSSAKTTTPSSSDKTATEKTTTLSSLDKTTTEKTTTPSTSDKTTTEKTTTSSTTKGTTSSSSGKQPSQPPPRRGLSVFEMEREHELRIIRQRADSREEHEKTPTPMASMDSVEVQYEKLLVVERVSSEEARARTGRLQGEHRGATPRLSIVTQDEFSKLAMIVRRLQEKFDPIGAAEFPEKIQLMQELRKGASLTDAMAALQLSARLEAAEKALLRMTGIVTELASNYPDVDLSQFTQTGPETEVLYQGALGPSSQVPPAISKTAAFKQPPKSQKSKTQTAQAAESTMDASSTAQEGEGAIIETPKGAVSVVEEEKENPDWITVIELDVALQEVYDNIMNSLNTTINKNKANADAAIKMANRLEIKLNASLDLGTRMTDLETLVATYTEQINTLDAGLSSQMTNYQELLTQMQHDLESGLENMAEALANTGGDTAAVAELNGHFTNLQLDFETTNTRQNELREIQVALKLDLEELRKEIEILRGTKSDRDEVADALRDKVGLGTLNGLVSLEQFDAVRGDMEQRIGAAYEKFNNQEIVWQKAIDDILRKLDEKANWTQLIFLKEDMKMNIEKLMSRLKDMLDIVGEPQAAAVARKLHRDANCLSCATPAHMHLVEANTIPALPALPGKRPPTLGAESPPKLEEGVCYPGLPVTHPIDPRAHICNRYCGGSHTKITLSRAPAGMLINPAGPKPNAKSDEKIIRKPCGPCNVKPQEPKDVFEGDLGSDMTPVDFRMAPMNTAEDAINVTPPVAAEEY